MQNPNLDSFTDEFEKIALRASTVGMISGGLGGALLGRTMAVSSKDYNKLTDQQKKMNRRSAAAAMALSLGATGYSLGSLRDILKPEGVTVHHKLMSLFKKKKQDPAVRLKPIPKPDWFKGIIQGGKSKKDKPDWIVPDNYKPPDPKKPKG